MKIIQSLWSGNTQDVLNKDFGWIAPEYHYISWALSSLQLNTFYEDITLYTVTASARILIDTLRLPYKNVICNLDELSYYSPKLWALPKILAYSLQNEAFLHVDGDVFIWKKFDEDLIKSNLIAQNMESATKYYEEIMQKLECSLKFFPDEIKSERRQNNQIYAYNAGILGGNDIDFFKIYTKKAFEFVNKNIEQLSMTEIENFNIFFEQYLFYCLAKKDEKKVTVLFKETIGDNEYKGFSDFTDVPYNKFYLHLLGNSKKYNKTCEEMAKRLQEAHPEYYYRIISFFRNKKLPLQKDYYYSKSNLQSESDFILDFNRLKNDYKKSTLEIRNKQNRSYQPDKIFFRKSIVDNNFKILISQKQQTETELRQIYERQLSDLNVFEFLLEQILLNKFNNISEQYLYARDSSCLQYYEYILKDKRLTNLIVFDNLVEYIKTDYNWCDLVQMENSDVIAISKADNIEGNAVYTAIIPECDLKGYSLANIDELDLLIFMILKTPISIGQLLNELKPSFEIEELESLPTQFEKLIFGRIKMGLQSKTLKAIIHK